MNLYRGESWPYQEKLPDSVWELWRRYLKQLFLSRGQQLKKPLGAWLHVGPEWPWYMSKDSKHLLKKDDEGWLSFPVITQRPIFPIYSLEGRPTAMRKDHYIATVAERWGQLLCSGFAKTPIKDVRSLFFDAYVEGQPNKWCFESLRMPKDPSHIIKALQDGLTRAISDGFYKKDTAPLLYSS